MKLVKRTSGYYSNIYLALLMRGAPPATAAELKARVNIYSFEDLFNHEDRVGYVWLCAQGADRLDARYLKPMQSPVLKTGQGFCPDRMYRIDPTTFLPLPINNDSLCLVKQALLNVSQSTIQNFVRGTLDNLMGWHAATTQLAFEYQWDQDQTFDGYTIGGCITGGIARGGYLYASVYYWDSASSQWVTALNNQPTDNMGSDTYLALTPFTSAKIRVVHKTYQQADSSRVGGVGNQIRMHNTPPTPTQFDIRWALAINLTRFTKNLISSSDPVPMLCFNCGGPEQAGELTLSQNIGVQGDAQISCTQSFISLGDLE